jgi:DNA-binding transcriptional LysR family regulator
MTVKSGGVTIAAKKLSISQPSLSGQLKVLEDFLQKKLFKKIGRKNELTRDGEMVFGFCRQMFELSEEMHESITEEIPHASRRLYIGVTNEIAQSFVVEVISHFLKKYSPKLRPKVKMISGTHEKLVDLLVFREIDVLVTEYSAKNPDLENLLKVEVPMNLICSLDKDLSPLERYMNISNTLKSIYGTNIPRWVAPPVGTKIRTEINDFFEANSLNGDFVFESDIIESITRSVVDEVGTSFLPLVYIPKELENKSIFSFGPKKGYWKHRIWIACHQKSKDDTLINSLSHSFKEVCTPLIKR